MGERIRDVWVTDGEFDDKYKPDEETVQFRFWDGPTA
jgi:hypothetical protein